MNHEKVCILPVLPPDAHSSCNMATPATAIPALRAHYTVRRARISITIDPLMTLEIEQAIIRNWSQTQVVL